MHLALRGGNSGESGDGVEEHHHSGGEDQQQSGEHHHGDSTSTCDSAPPPRWEADGGGSDDGNGGGGGEGEEGSSLYDTAGSTSKALALRFAFLTVSLLLGKTTCAHSQQRLAHAW